MLGIEKKLLIRSCKGQILVLVLQEFQKLAVNNSMEKPVVLSFVDFSTIFCPRLSEEIYFYLQLSPDPMELIFLIQTHSLLKLIFKQAGCHKDLHQIFQQALFCILVSSTIRYQKLLQSNQDSIYEEFLAFSY